MAFVGSCLSHQQADFCFTNLKHQFNNKIDKLSFLKSYDKVFIALRTITFEFLIAGYECSINSRKICIFYLKIVFIP